MTERKYKIGIIGGGSVGLTYAAILADKASIIVKTRRKEQAEHIRTHGISLTEIFKTPIQSKDKKETVINGIEATSNLEDLIDSDAVIITVKSYDTESVAKELSEVLKTNTEILTIQNGLQALKILKTHVKNPDRVFGGVTIIAATRLDDRSVTVGYRLRTIIDSKAIILAEVLHASRFDLETTTNVNQAIWDKMVLNTGQNALGAITNLNFTEMYESKECLRIAQKLLDEFEQVAEAEGITFNYLLMDKLKDNWRTSKHHPSMWQDIQNNKKTEVDAINGVISRLGEKHRIATPYNDMITSLIKILQK